MSVYATLSVLKGFLKPKSRADISSITFNLHRMTAALLLACSILTTSKQFFGEPIHCIAPGNIPTPVFQSYCWMTGTYTINLSRPEEVQVEVAHPGVAQGSGVSDERNQFHTYYQWVCLVLVLQAVAAYLPYYLWKVAEGGKVGKLMAKVSSDLITETSLSDQVAGLSDFLAQHHGWFNSSCYKLLLCHVGCLVSSVTQMYLMNVLLAGHFLSLGSKLADLTELQHVLTFVFPKVVKCSMASYGPSGSMVPQHGLCTLPINIVNEKLYLVLWIWFLGLVLVTSLQLAHSLLLLQCPALRQLQLRSHCPFLDPRVVRKLVRRATYGDTVLLHLVAKNCDPAQFSALLSMLAEVETDLQDDHVLNIEEQAAELVKRKGTQLFRGDGKRGMVV